MNCEELRPGYLLYALGALEEPERSEVRAHLDRGCQNCAAGVRDARACAFGIAASVEGPAPPSRLRSRVLAAAGGSVATRWNWFRASVAAGATALAAAAILAYQARNFRSDLTAVRTELERHSAEAASAREALDLIQAPDTREVAFGQGRPAPPRGRVFVNASGVLLVASRLPAPPPGKTYEMWVIRAGKPAPAGLFASDAQGDAFHLFHLSAPLQAGDAVAVTLEAAGGVNAPTSAPVIVAAL